MRAAIVMSLAVWGALAAPGLGEDAASDQDALREHVRAYMDAPSQAARARAYERISEHPRATVANVADALRTYRDYPRAEPGRVMHELKGRAGRPRGRYTAIVPSGYDPARPWPLILALEGGSGDGAKYAPLWQRVLKGQTYLVVCPIAVDYWWHTSHAIAFLALKDALKRYHVDRNRVYITGRSNGGSGTWYMAMHYPDLFAAAAPMAGAPQTGKRRLDYPYLLNLLHVPVYAVHGAADPTIRAKFDRKAVGLMTSAGYDCRLDEIPDGGHGSPHQRLPQVLAWLATKQRQPHPKRVRFLKQATGATLCYWLFLGRTSRPASIDAQIADDNSIQLKTSRLGQVTLFLNDQLVDLSRPVAITHNGQRLGFLKPQPSVKTLLASARIFDDPTRLYPVAKTLKLAK